MRTATAVAMLLSMAPPMFGQAPVSDSSVRVVIYADSGRDTISRHIYGQFAEHLGRDIYDGFWTKGKTGQWHLRADVLEALRRIKVPNVRWPGGCFADSYHWKDGIGPRSSRPRIVNTIWGGVTEDNSFGTHEYLDLVTRIGAAPFIVGNVGSGTPQEMAQWWEYVNADSGSPMADLRTRNGRPRPWGVRRWGVGNESWGCGGNMTPEYYADVYKRFVTFLPAYGQTRPFRIATGPNSDDYHWTDVVMREAGRMIDGLDLHYYTVVGSWSNKGSATDFTEREWFTALEKALHIEELITRHAEIMDRYDPRKRVALIVGEWGMWHDVEPGTNPAFLYQQNTLRDALVAAVSLDVFHRHADRVRGANIAQTINVLQSMILTQGARMVLTPTYHVFDMYSVHQDALLLPLAVEGGRYELEGRSLPAVSASASRDGAGRIHLSLTNLDPHRALPVSADLRGAHLARVSGRVLTADSMNAHNTFDRPDAVQPRPFDIARLVGDKVVLELPPKSIVVLELR